MLKTKSQILGTTIGKKKKQETQFDPNRVPDTLQTEVEERLINKPTVPNIFTWIVFQFDFEITTFSELIEKPDEGDFMNVLEDGRVTRFNYQRFKAIELACNYFSILGVILSVYQVLFKFILTITILMCF